MVKMGHNKRAKEIAEALTIALNEILFSPQAENGFYCPFGKLSYTTINELKRCLTHVEGEVEFLKIGKAKLESRNAILEKDLSKMQSALEECERSRSEKEMEVQSMLQRYELRRGEIESSLSHIQDLLKRRSFSPFVNELTLIVGEKIKSSLMYESIYAAGAIKLSGDIMLEVVQLLKKGTLKPDKLLNETKSMLTGLEPSLNNEMYDPRIPMIFAKLARFLIEKAEWAREEGESGVAVGYRNAAKELIQTTKSLYENPEISRLLSALAGR